MIEVSLYDALFEPDKKLTYSVITARYNGKWLFVRHQKRNTFEIPGGHIENNESPLEAAKRELTEETGAIDFSIDCVSTYEVKEGGEKGYGRLYFAEIFKIGAIQDKSEICEILFLENLPERLTYPDIQPCLFNRVIDYLNKVDYY